MPARKDAGRRDQRGKRLRTIARKYSSGERTVVVLDVGTRKMCCLIARLLPRPAWPDAAMSSRIHILGFGHQLSRGIHSGRVSDMVAAEHSVRGAVSKAERAADVMVNEVYVTTSFGPLHNQSFTASIDLPSGSVTLKDMERIKRAGLEYASRSGLSVLHSVPVSYTLGYESGISDPLGMIGDTLKVDVHAVSTDALPLRNLRHCIERSHLSVSGLASAGYASARSVLVESEAQTGVTCLDMGAGTTGVTVFSSGGLIYCDSVDMGSHHITSDIAHAFSMTLTEAERMKTLHASVFAAGARMSDGIITDEDDGGTGLLSRHISKAELSDLARIRLEQIFIEVCARLRSSGIAPMSGNRLVLTGGASELVGAAELAGQIFGKQARLGRPRPIPGLPPQAAEPAFAAPLGLLVHLLDDDLRLETGVAPEIIASSQGYLARVGQWFRESF